MNNDPINAIDPDGRDVFYQNRRDEKFYTKAAAKNRLVAETLAYFGEGTGRDLHIRRGDPGTRPNGEQRRGVTSVTAAPGDASDPAVEARMVAASEAAGGGEAGMEAALEAQKEVTGAEIILGPAANNHTRLHELGHVNHAITNLPDFLQAVAEAMGLSGNAYKTSKAERTANAFADAAKEDDPPPPEGE